MQNVMQTGDTVTKDFGPTPDRTVLHVRVDRHHNGVAFTITNHPTLNRAFTDLGQARTYLTLLRDMATAGKQVWKIETAAAVLTSTQTVFDDAERTLIQAVNNDLDTAHTARVDAYEAEQKAVQDAVGDRSYRRVRNTRTHVFAKPLSAPQRAAIAGHQDGVVRLGDGVTRPMLAALADKGFGTLNFEVRNDRRQVIESLTLNAAGLQLTASQIGATA